MFLCFCAFCNPVQEESSGTVQSPANSREVQRGHANIKEYLKPMKRNGKGLRSPLQTNIKEHYILKLENRVRELENLLSQSEMKSRVRALFISTMCPILSVCLFK